MVKYPTKYLRANLADVMNRAAYSGERAILMRHGKGVAAIVSVEDAQLLEMLENKVDVAEARKVIAARKTRKPRPWAEVKKELGL